MCSVVLGKGDYLGYVPDLWMEASELVPEDTVFTERLAVVGRDDHPFRIQIVEEGFDIVEDEAYVVHLRLPDAIEVPGFIVESGSFCGVTGRKLVSTVGSRRFGGGCE